MPTGGIDGTGSLGVRAEGGLRPRIDSNLIYCVYISQFELNSGSMFLIHRTRDPEESMQS